MGSCQIPWAKTTATDRTVRRTMSGPASVCEVVSASVLCSVASALVTNVEPEKPLVVADQGPAPTSQPVRQEGTVIAVSAGSVTARSANGYTQTCLVTPNTTVITQSGGQTATAPTYFAVNDHVDIVGTIRARPRWLQPSPIETRERGGSADRLRGKGNAHSVEHTRSCPC